jgi:hypothetical protein
MEKLLSTLLVAFGVGSVCCATSEQILYENNFAQAEIGQVPAEFLVLEGAFAVREQDGNRFLELPGAPLDSFGVLFGPPQKSDVSVSARFHGTAQGRRYPAFAVGLNGAAGYRLQISPGRKQFELIKADRVVKGIPYQWQPGKWTHLRLQVRQITDGHWNVEGRAWPEDQPEPSEWMISLAEEGELYAGRASVFGFPFSGTPIRFDDLRVTRIPNQAGATE